MAEHDQTEPGPAERAFKYTIDTSDVSVTESTIIEGEALAGSLADIIAKLPGNYLPMTRERAMAYVLDLQDRVITGEPVLFGTWDRNTGVFRVDNAGWVGMPLQLVYDKYFPGWRLALTIRSQVEHTRINHRRSVDLTTILSAAEEHAEMPFIVGETAVKTWVRSGLMALQPEDRRDEAWLDADLDLLNELSHDFPLSYLELTEDETSNLVDSFFLSLLSEEDGYFRQSRLINVLDYLLHTEGADHSDAYAIIMDRMAHGAPLDRVSRRVLGNMMIFAEEMHSKFPRLPDRPAYSDEGRAFILADWYRRKAIALEAEHGPGEPPAPRAPHEPVPAPPLRELAIIHHKATPDAIKRDNTYVTSLRLAQVPVRELDISFADARAIGNHLTRPLISSDNQVLQQATLANLEYLFDAAHPGARPAFYDELLNKCARFLPNSSFDNSNLTPFLTAARVIHAAFPEVAISPLTGNVVHGEAAIAAIISSLYSRKQRQLHIRNNYNDETEIKPYLPIAGLAVNALSVTDEQVAAIVDRLDHRRLLRAIASAMRRVLSQRETEV